MLLSLSIFQKRILIAFLIVIFSIVFFLPMVASAEINIAIEDIRTTLVAQSPGTVGVGCQLDFQTSIKTGLNSFTCFISRIVIPMLFALATFMFIYGVLVYIAKQDDESARTRGKQFMLWGIIAMFMMSSVFALVQVVLNTFKL